MSTQLFSRDAVLKIDETTPTAIGYLKNVRINITHTKVKEYDDAIAHVFRANYGDRGDVKAGIGTISQMLGLNRRVLLSITLMQAQSGNDYSTDHSSDQLLLKVTAEHTQRETARPYPVLTYVDGSLDYGRA